MPHITRHDGPDDLTAAEERATQQRLEQEAQALQARHERAEASKAFQRGVQPPPQPHELEQERLRLDARAAYAEQRHQAIAQESGEPYAPPAPADPTSEPGAEPFDDGPAAA